MALYNPKIVRKEVDTSHHYYVDGVFFPGVTTILHKTLPMPEGLSRWRGNIGNDAADLTFELAGSQGTQIHNAVERLLKGGKIKLKEEFAVVPGLSTKRQMDKRKKMLVGFCHWYHEYQPTIDTNLIEFTVASRLGFAGTLDLATTMCFDQHLKPKTKPQPWIIDFKTSSGIYISHYLQIIAYKQAYFEMTGQLCNVGILHLNPRVRKGYTFVTKMAIKKKEVLIDDFLTVFEQYKMLNGGKIESPKLVDVYPDELQLYKQEKKS